MSMPMKQAADSAPATGASVATTSVETPITAAPATGQTEGAQPQQSSATTPGGMDAEALREEVRRAIKAEYEGKGGKMSKLQSENARLKKAEMARQTQIVNQAKQAMQANTPEANAYAAQVLAAQVEDLQRMQAEAGTEEETVKWVEKIAADLGLEVDDEVQTELGKVWERGPWDVHQTVARLAKQREAARAEEAEKKAKAAMTELETVKADIPRLVKAEFTKALAAGGFSDPESTTAGPPTFDEGWRKKSAQQLFRAGLEARRKSK